MSPFPETWGSPEIDEFNRLVRAQHRANMAAIETACEMMLVQDGTDHGVLVEQHDDCSVTASLSPDVPFGQIHYTHGKATR